MAITCPIHEIFGCFKFPEWMTQRGSNGSKDLDMHPAHGNLYPFLALLCVRACDSPKRSAPAVVFTCSMSLAIAAFYLVVALWKQKGTLGALGFCIFCFFMFFSLFSFPPFHMIHMSKKSRKTKKKQKNNPVRRIWSKSIPDCFFCFFGFPRFSRGFCCPKPNCPKTQGKPKKTKKTIL